MGGGTAAERGAGAEPSREKAAGKVGENVLWNCRPRCPASSLLSEASRLEGPPECRTPGSAMGSLVDDPDACERASMVARGLKASLRLITWEKGQVGSTPRVRAGFLTHAMDCSNALLELEPL